MNKERADSSYDLHPYLKTFYDYKDVKYEFSAENIVYRKRKIAAKSASISKVHMFWLDVC